MHNFKLKLFTLQCATKWFTLQVSEFDPKKTIKLVGYSIKGTVQL